MVTHFENLWCKSESLHKDIEQETVADIIKEITMKLGLFSAISQKNLANEDLENAKTHLMGEILLSLTKLSLKENIDVYVALNTAIMQHNISNYTTKY